MQQKFPAFVFARNNVVELKEYNVECRLNEYNVVEYSLWHYTSRAKTTLRRYLF